MGLAGKAQALVGLGRTEEAMETFAAAREVTFTNYVGIPGTRLNIFEAEARLAGGDAEGAMRLLEPDAVMGGDDEALELLGQAYSQAKGSEAGLSEYLGEARIRLARSVDDLTLPTYDGDAVSLSEIGAGKVVLLTFWFPT
jgi:hypothetical protein